MVGRCTASVIASASRKLFFSPFEYGRTYFAGNKPCLVPKRLKLAAEVMRANAGFHADQARWQVGESRLDLATRPLPPKHDRAAPIVAYDVERVFANTDADRGDGAGFLRHDVLLAGFERGRTHPISGHNPG